jgi:hypothetical protein
LIYLERPISGNQGGTPSESSLWESERWWYTECRQQSLRQQGNQQCNIMPITVSYCSPEITHHTTAHDPNLDPTRAIQTLPNFSFSYCSPSSLFLLSTTTGQTPPMHTTPTTCAEYACLGNLGTCYCSPVFNTPRHFAVLDVDWSGLLHGEAKRTSAVLLYNSNVGWHGMGGAVLLAELAIVDRVGGCVQ